MPDVAQSLTVPLSIRFTPREVVVIDTAAAASEQTRSMFIRTAAVRVARQLVESDDVAEVS